MDAAAAEEEEDGARREVRSSDKEGLVCGTLKGGGWARASCSHGGMALAHGGRGRGMAQVCGMVLVLACSNVLVSCMDVVLEEEEVVVVVVAAAVEEEETYISPHPCKV